MSKAINENNVININSKDLDKPIYRIFTIERFIDLIMNSENGLVHPSKWDDPFENFFLKNLAEMSDGELVSLDELSKCWYGQCWTLNKDSDAMWRIYSHDQKGIRVGTTIRKLFTNFYNSSDNLADLNYLIGSVIYKERNEIEKFLAYTTFTDLAIGGQPHNFAKTLLIKRSEFSHENEVRLLFHDSAGNHGKNQVAIFPFQWKDIIDDIALDPRLSESAFNNMKNCLSTLGYTLSINQSELYKFTPTTIKFS